MTATRRLAAILADDVAGYSRLMGAEEEGTLARLTFYDASRSSNTRLRSTPQA
jgi:class 3 adenylate cyclase